MSRYAFEEDALQEDVGVLKAGRGESWGRQGTWFPGINHGFAVRHGGFQESTVLQRKMVSQCNP